MKIQGVYSIRNVLNGKIYVGSSVDVFSRWADHKYEASRDKYKYPLYNAIRKYGLDKFEFSVVEEVKETALLNARETSWIAYYKAASSEYGYNICKEAATTFGYRHSEESKLKMSLTKKGKNRKHSEDWRKRHSLLLQGRKHSEETKKKISLAQIGKKLSEEHIKKMREKLKGRKLSEETLQKLRNKRHSEETKKKISEAGKNRVVSEETRQKLRSKRHSEETKRRMSESRKKYWQSVKNKKFLILDRNSVEGVSNYAKTCG